MPINTNDCAAAVVNEINLARTRPREYAGLVNAVLLRSQPQHHGAEELFNVLRVRSAVGGVKLVRGLSSAAAARAEAVSQGVHARETSAETAQRVLKYGVVEEPATLKEVVWVGRYGNDVRQAVLAMLADDTNPTRSRRTSLLSATAGACGVGCVGNVVCILLCKNFTEGVPTNATPLYQPTRYEEPRERVALPTRQVMTPRHNAARAAPGGAPRFTAYDDIRHVINAMPNLSAKLDAGTGGAGGGYGHLGAAGGSASAGLSKWATSAAAVGASNLHSGSMNAAAPPAAVGTPKAAAAAAVAAKGIPPPALPRVGVPEPKLTEEEMRYPGVILGLDSIKTTLATDNGESNYVGYTSKLHDRICNWLKGVNNPVHA